MKYIPDTSTDILLYMIKKRLDSLLNIYNRERDYHITLSINAYSNTYTKKSQ